MGMKMKWLLLVLVGAFLLLAANIETLWLAKIDNQLLLQFENIRNDFLTEAFQFISDVGSIKGLLFISGLATVYLLYRKRIADVLFLMIVFWGSRGINSIIKNWVERDRPEINPLFNAAGFSFPSGHAMNSAAVLGFFCFLLCFHLKSERFRKGSVIVTVLLVVFIGASRIYLGVHYMTDIIGGYLAGIIWMLIAVSLYNYLESEKG